MKQKTRPAIIPLMLVLTSFMGCSVMQPKPQAVVINIENLAEATQLNEKIKVRIDTMNQQFAEEMKELSERLNKELDDRRASLGDNPSKEDQKAIQTLRGQGLKEIMQAQAEGKERINKATSEIRQSYLDEIMSIAEAVAREHGSSIVLTARAVFWSEGTLDITDEVIERMSSGTDEGPAGVESE